MNFRARAIRILVMTFLLVTAAPAASRGSGGHESDGHSKGDHGKAGESMKAQHERMANFREAADAILNGIIHSAGKMVFGGAERLERSLEGQEADMPHKNRSRAKEFHGLYVELGQRAGKLKDAVRKDDLPAAATAYGRILEICVTCHIRFRD